MVSENTGPRTFTETEKSTLWRQIHGYAEAVYTKMLSSAEEKGKPIDPWVAFSLSYLEFRFSQESREYWEARTPTARTNESKDLGATAFFLYMKNRSRLD